MALLAATVVFCGPASGTEEGAHASGGRQHLLTTLYFSGIDLWRHGSFMHGGLLWAPAGLDNDGYVLKLLTAGGTYRYQSGIVPGGEVFGEQRLAALMLGARFKRGSLEATMLLGPELQDHRLSPDDPGNLQAGRNVGLRVSTDLWWEPRPSLMMAGSLSFSTADAGYWTRIAAGWRLLNSVWIGPEGMALGTSVYRQTRIGVHLTGLRGYPYEWSAGVGVANDSDARGSAYLRLGLILRR